MIDRMVNLLIKSLLSLFQHLPERIGLSIGSFLGGVAFVVCYPRTRVAVSNLDRAMGQDLGKLRVWRLIFRMYRNFGKNVIDYFRLPLLSQGRRPGSLPFQISVDGVEYMQQAFEGGRGVLILSAHLGNWELMAAWIAHRGYPLNVLTRGIRQPALNRWVLATRESLGIGSIYKKDSIREMISRLKKGEFVAFVLDQKVNRREGVKVRFFNRPAWTISGLAVFSSRYDVPVLPMFIFREEGLRHRIVIEPPIYFKATGTMEESIQEHTQLYSDILERHIRAHPDQWIWIHKRWEGD